MIQARFFLAAEQSNIVSYFFIVCLFTLASGGQVFGQSGQQRKNVLFILVDDLRPNLGCYGDMNAYTPNIDKLAQQGIVFNKAYCQQAVCNPSRTSMLTGLRPGVTKVYNLDTHFRDNLPDAVTLPQSFKNSGYFTASVGKIFHNSKNTVDPISWTIELSPAYNNTYVLPKNRSGKGKQGVTEMADVPDSAYADGMIAEGAIQLLAEAAQQDDPFFIAVGFKKPHAPFCAPKKYWDLYDRSAFGVAGRSRPAGSPDLAFHRSQELRGYRDVPDEGDVPSEKEQEIIHGYYACISYVDAQLGKILDRLEALGLSENTVIVLWGDHGYHLGEQDLWCKSTNFELDTRVPLIVAAPGMKGNGSHNDAIVESVDIFPTLVDLCGIAPREELNGVSMLPLLDNPFATWGYPAFSQFVRPYEAIFKKNAPTHMGYSVRVEGWRCTYWYDLEKHVVVERELYQMGGNGLESENMAGRPAVAELEAELVALIDQYRNNQYRKTVCN